MSFFFFFRSLFGSFRLEWTVSINGSFFFSFFRFVLLLFGPRVSFFISLFFFQWYSFGNDRRLSLSLSLSLKRARYVNELISREL